MTQNANTTHETSTQGTLTDFELELATASERISRSQHIDILSSPNHKGKYFYTIDDEPDVKTPWIGIDKTGAEYEQHAFETQAELAKWLKGEYKPDASSNTTIPAAAARPEISDDMDAMDILMAAQGNIDKAEAATEFLPTGAPIPYDVGTAGLGFDADRENLDRFIEETRKDVLSNLSDADLKAKVIAERDAFFLVYRKAAVLEARLKAARQRFDEENAFLIGETKAAIQQRNLSQDALKLVAKLYGEQTGDKQFDQYIGFRETTVIDWDEPTVIAWCTDNYPAALINPGVTVDATRFKTYVKDCLKKKQPVPPSVTVKHPLEVTISSKIPVPELEEVKAS